MSNYLNHLVARSLNVTETVQPRLPSLFEPQPGFAGLNTAPDLTLEQLAFTVRSDETEVEAQSQSRMPERRGVEQPLELRSPPPNAQPSPTVSQPPPVSHFFEQTRLASLDRESSPSSPPPLPQPSIGSEELQFHPLSRSHPSTTGDQTEATPLRGATEPGGLPVIEPTVVQQVVVERVVEPLAAITPRELPSIQTTHPTELPKRVPQSSSTHLVAPNIPSSVETPETPTQSQALRPPTPGVIVQPQVTSSIHPVAIGSAEPVEPSRPAPTIQVTIGRIEVRATPPPASTQPKPRPASPVMSLDEYLRQRGGGK